jgi:hypothetical protein
LWGIFAGWKYLMVRRAAKAIHAAIESEWPAEGTPSLGTRERLLAAAVQMDAGDFDAVVDDLGTEVTVSDKQQTAAQRFLSSRRDLGEQFALVAAEARMVERDGGDVQTARTALSRALIAGARQDRDATALQIEIAKVALKASLLGQEGTAAAGEEAVAGMLEQVGPSFLVGRELMTQGHEAVRKLLVRTKQHHHEKDYLNAAALVRLAAQLSGVDASATAAESPPEWFLGLEPLELLPAEKEAAEAAVELCRSMAAAAEPSEPVKALIRSAKRELTAGRFDEALWWATVSLNALGMSDQEIESALPRPEET